MKGQGSSKAALAKRFAVLTRKKEKKNPYHVEETFNVWKNPPWLEVKDSRLAVAYLITFTFSGSIEFKLFTVKTTHPSSSRPDPGPIPGVMGGWDAGLLRILDTQTNPNA